MSGGVNARDDLDAARPALKRLGLNQVAAGLEESLTDAVKENFPPRFLLDELLALEHSQREEWRIRTSLKNAGLPTGLTMSNFDWTFQPPIADIVDIARSAPRMRVMARVSTRAEGRTGESGRG